jgi:TRAP-type C4-dicarboxylate transport system substrate-binding protein
MKKTLTAAVVGLSLAAVSATAALAEPIRLKMASTYPSKLTQLGTLGKTLESNINEMAGGEIQIKFYEPGALVPALEVFDAVKNGLGRRSLVNAGLLAGQGTLRWRSLQPCRSVLTRANTAHGCCTATAKS